MATLRLRGIRLFYLKDVDALKLIVGMVTTMNPKSFTGTNTECVVDTRFTAVEPVSFRVVCNAIAKYAFVTSNLPVIISLEVHCSIEQQHAMVDVFSIDITLMRFYSEEFGDLASEK